MPSLDPMTALDDLESRIVSIDQDLADLTAEMQADRIERDWLRFFDLIIASYKRLAPDQRQRVDDDVAYYMAGRDTEYTDPRPDHDDADPCELCDGTGWVEDETDPGYLYECGCVIDEI